MTEMVRDIWEGLLELIAPIIIPDWGALIELIPLGLLLLILVGLSRLAWRWLRFYLTQPVRRAGPLGRDYRSNMLRGGMLVGVGFAIVLVALTILPDRPNRVAEVGPDTVILIVGIVLALAGAALAIRAAEVSDETAEQAGSSTTGRELAVTAGGMEDTRSVKVPPSRSPDAYA